MIIYAPAHFEERDYRPSWIGNNWYPTATIRGIFDSEEKAIEALKDWEYMEDYDMLIRDIEEEEEITSFDIDYDDGYLYIWSCVSGDYNLNEIVDESYSAVYDPEHLIGVSDY
jgi:hypothetical protein